MNTIYDTELSKKNFKELIKNKKFFGVKPKITLNKNCIEKIQERLLKYETNPINKDKLFVHYQRYLDFESIKTNTDNETNNVTYDENSNIKRLNDSNLTSDSEIQTNSNNTNYQIDSFYRKYRNIPERQRAGGKNERSINKNSKSNLIIFGEKSNVGDKELEKMYKKEEKKEEEERKKAAKEEEKRLKQQKKQEQKNSKKEEKIHKNPGKQEKIHQNPDKNDKSKQNPTTLITSNEGTQSKRKPSKPDINGIKFKNPFDRKTNDERPRKDNTKSTVTQTVTKIFCNMETCPFKDKHQKDRQKKEV